MQASIAVYACGDDVLNRATSLAKQLNIPLCDHPKQVDIVLALSAERLECRIGKLRPIYIDFLHGELAHRQQYGGGSRQMLARAVGIKAGYRPSVIDATAGLGRDAFILASLGCKVIMLERSAIIAALLEDGLKRAQADSNFKQLSLSLVATDAIQYLNNIPKQQQPDVIYIDPMFPKRRKSALVKKEMRILREIVGHDADALQLLTTACKVARKRVVVKYPRLTKRLTEQNYISSIIGKTTRFDIYRPD